MKATQEGFLLHGGRNKEVLGDMHYFDLRSKQSVALKLVNSPPPRFNHTIVQASKRFYLFGGFTSSNSVDNAFYSIEICNDSAVFTQIKPVGYLPTARGAHSMTAVIDNTLCLYGGISKDSSCLGDMHIYKVTENIWIEVKGTKIPRSYCSVNSFKRKLVVLGG